MKGRLAIVLILCCVTTSVMAQNGHGCGTQPFKDPWLTDFQVRLDQNTLRSPSDTILYVPVSLHMVGDDNGGGYFPVSRVLAAFCVLNEDYAYTNIQFFINGDSLNYLRNSSWYDHDDIRTGAKMMFANNIPNTINCYIVQNPASNCGYNLPYAGIALMKGCMGINDHTWAHEVGHNLSLPHPFLGWEGGITHDGSMAPRFNQPAPEYVTYDYTLFKDKFYPDTTIIDTAMVEYVDGRNCREAADGFCDTHPDYLASRWACNSDSNSTVSQLDPDSMRFVSDGRWIMSYSLDNCNKGFSQEQILAMRANLREQKPGHLFDQSAPVVLTERPILLFPIDETVQFNSVWLEWEEVNGASHYLVEVSRIPSFGFLNVETIVTENNLLIQDLDIDRKYYWRVRPFNRHNTCTGPSEVASFLTGELSSTDTPDWLADLRIGQTADEVSVSLGLNGQLQRLEFYLFDVNGRSVHSSQGQINGSRIVHKFRTTEMVPGLYLLNIKAGHKQHTLKLLIK